MLRRGIYRGAGVKPCAVRVCGANHIVRGTGVRPCAVRACGADEVVRGTHISRARTHNKSSYQTACAKFFQKMPV